VSQQPYPLFRFEGRKDRTAHPVVWQI